MDEPMQAAADRDQICQLLARYVRGIDRRDRALLESIYWPGAREIHGRFIGPADEFIDWVLDGLGRLKWTNHVLGQSAIEIEGQSAGAETYFVAYHVRAADGGGDYMDLLGGRYLDRLEKRGGDWRVVERTVMYDWDHGHALTPYYDPASFKDFAANHGSRDRADPSFRILRRG